MTNDIFKTVRMTASEQERSFQWYKNQIVSLGSNVTGREVIKSGKLTMQLMPGHMYLFMYDPKHKKTLPYYDTFPLVLPFRKLPDGFLGINLHYLPYLMRFNLLGELSKYAMDKKYDEKTRIRISWELLENSSKLLPATACVKHYLSNHLKTQFLKINYPDWITAAMLPIENFVKQRKENVWKETRKKIGR
jgi:hypothetical protein